MQKILEVEAFFAVGHFFHGHVQALLFVEALNDFGYGYTSLVIKKIFAEFAPMFCEGFAPGDVMKGHGIGDGAIAIE